MKPGLMNDAPTKVLVVEDEAAAARRPRRCRSPRPMGSRSRATRAAEPTRCARWCPTTRIDLVLLDIQLPDISGMDVLRRLRAAGCDVDVMAVTVLRDPSMLQAAMALGVVHYLLKPFTAATVRQKLEHYRAFRARRIAAAGHANRPAGDRRALQRAARDGRRHPSGWHRPGDAARRGHAAAPLGSDVRRASRRDPRRIARHCTPLPGVPHRVRAGQTGLPIRRDRPARGRVPVVR